jgi:hypothetical protein
MGYTGGILVSLAYSISSSSLVHDPTSGIARYFQVSMFTQLMILITVSYVKLFIYRIL